eukprot:1479365-Rhodomonas_salina.1
MSLLGEKGKGGGEDIVASEVRFRRWAISYVGFVNIFSRELALESRARALSEYEYRVCLMYKAEGL